ncbi:hypothetical protein JOD18_000954 [Gracilibacillus alcaliphilus]|nr:hypothetical protein [Gracilibacillus alcaliphilus]
MESEVVDRSKSSHLYSVKIMTRQGQYGGIGLRNDNKVYVPIYVWES